MVDEIQISGKTFISSKRAAKETEYTQDYIGQLCRKGLIQAQRVAGLWYVDLDSLKDYKSGAEKYIPVPPAYTPPRNPETLVSFDGKEYISASRASQITGYNQDYIGQLARSGKVISRQAGNRWYIESQALLNHKKEKDALLAEVQKGSVGLPTKPTPKEILVTTVSKEVEKGIMEYKTEHAEILPSLTEKQTPKNALESQLVPRPAYSPDMSQPLAIRLVNTTKVTPEESQKYDVDKVTGLSIFKGTFKSYRVLIIIAILIVSAGSIYLVSKSLQSSSSGQTSTNTMSGTEGSRSALLNSIEDLVSPEIIYKRAPTE